VTKLILVPQTVRYIFSLLRKVSKDNSSRRTCRKTVPVCTCACVRVYALCRDYRFVFQHLPEPNRACLV